MKMVTAGDIYDFLNVCAPFETAMSFDNAGFLVGERQTPVPPYCWRSILRPMW